MKNTVKFRFAGIGIALVMCAVFGVAVMLLWNVLMPQIFALPKIGYLQAAGLLVLARILFGGFGGGRQGGYRRSRGHHFHHGNKLREKWMGMSEDERKEFIKKERDFAGLHRLHSHFYNFFDDEEEKEQNAKGSVKKDERSE